MPHLIYEATPAIRKAIDFPTMARTVHELLAATGHAVLDELKSRLYAADEFLAGDDPSGEFIVVRLVLSKARSPQIQRSMGEVVHDAIESAIAPAAGDRWWQCCVFVVDASGDPYIKSISGSHRISMAGVA